MKTTRYLNIPDNNSLEQITIKTYAESKDIYEFLKTKVQKLTALGTIKKVYLFENTSFPRLHLKEMGLSSVKDIRKADIIIVPEFNYLNKEHGFMGTYDWCRTHDFNSKDFPALQNKIENYRSALHTWYGNRSQKIDVNTIVDKLQANLKQVTEPYDKVIIRDSLAKDYEFKTLHEIDLTHPLFDPTMAVPVVMENDLRQLRPGCLNLTDEVYHNLRSMFKSSDPEDIIIASLSLTNADYNKDKKHIISLLAEFYTKIVENRTHTNVLFKALLKNYGYSGMSPFRKMTAVQLIEQIND